MTTTLNKAETVVVVGSIEQEEDTRTWIVAVVDNPEKARRFVSRANNKVDMLIRTVWSKKTVAESWKMAIDAIGDPELLKLAGMSGNCGRWDYYLSNLKYRLVRPAFVLPRGGK